MLSFIYLSNLFISSSHQCRWTIIYILLFVNRRDSWPTCSPTDRDTAGSGTTYLSGLHEVTISAATRKNWQVNDSSRISEMRLFQDRRTFVLSRNYRRNTNLAFASRYVSNGKIHQLKRICTHRTLHTCYINVSGPASPYSFPKWSFDSFTYSSDRMEYKFLLPVHSYDYIV